MIIYAKTSVHNTTVAPPINLHCVKRYFTAVVTRLLFDCFPHSNTLATHFMLNNSFFESLVANACNRVVKYFVNNFAAKQEEVSQY